MSLVQNGDGIDYVGVRTIKLSNALWQRLDLVKLGLILAESRLVTTDEVVGNLLTQAMDLLDERQIQLRKVTTPDEAIPEPVREPQVPELEHAQPVEDAPNLVALAPEAHTKGKRRERTPKPAPALDAFTEKHFKKDASGAPVFGTHSPVLQRKVVREEKRKVSKYGKSLGEVEAVIRKHGEASAQQIDEQSSYTYTTINTAIEVLLKSGAIFVKRLGPPRQRSKIPEKFYAISPGYKSPKGEAVQEEEDLDPPLPRKASKHKTPNSPDVAASWINPSK